MVIKRKQEVVIGGRSEVPQKLQIPRLLNTRTHTTMEHHASRILVVSVAAYPLSPIVVRNRKSKRAFCKNFDKHYARASSSPPQLEEELQKLAASLQLCVRVSRVFGGTELARAYFLSRFLQNAHQFFPTTISMSSISAAKHQIILECLCITRRSWKDSHELLA